MRGGDIFGDIGNAFRSLPQKAADALKIPTSVNDLKNLAVISQIPTDIGGVKRYGKTGISYALPAAGSAIGSELGRYASGGNPFAAAAGGTMGSIVGRIGAEQSNKALGSGIRRKRGRPRKMDGCGFLDGLLDKPFTARQAIQGAKSLPAFGREAIQDIRGAGFLDSFLDKPFTARQAIQGAKSLPAFGREAIQDIRGAGLTDDFAQLAMHGVAGKRVPKVKGLTSGVVPNVPGLTSGVIPMGGKGMRPAKGSNAMKEKMARLRAMKRK
jgi:hypothetical protein